MNSNSLWGNEESPFTTDLSKINWSLAGINELLYQILGNAEINETGGIAGGIADDIAEDNKSIDLHIVDLMLNIPVDIVDAIAGGIAGGIADRFISVLEIAEKVNSRKEIFSKLNMANNANNFETYIQPMVAINWLTMTIPNKPTSPNQQYRTTLKGRLILEFLKHQKAKKNNLS